MLPSDKEKSRDGKPSQEIVTETSVNLKRRVGLLSGVALLVGTMIGKP